jgi:putative intracellular protease/amidase
VLVAIPLFERFTALDAVGPYEALQRVPSIEVVFVGHQRGEVRSDNGMLGMTVDRAFAETSQLMIEYDPQPPFDSGSLAKASEATKQLAHEFYCHRA